MLKSLPEQGQLERAVKEAGPLLMQLMQAAAVPDWRVAPPMTDASEPTPMLLNYGLAGGVMSGMSVPVRHTGQLVPMMPHNVRMPIHSAMAVGQNLVMQQAGWRHPVPVSPTRTYHVH